MALNNLNLASKIPIVNALTNLRTTYNPQNAWLASGNKYLTSTSSRVGSDITNNSLVNNKVELTNYIATSVLIHCFNGWSYLSMSLNAYLEGDFSAAIHNAYYAELRSIMSFLSSQGIGTFNSNNVVVKANGNIVATDSLPTHKFVKAAFDEWLKNPSNSQLILKSLTIENKTLEDWLQNTHFLSSSVLPSRMASDWLTSWSIDLNTIQGETDFRNFVSYNPQTFKTNLGRYSDDIKNRLNYTLDLWNLCSPNHTFSHSILRSSLSDLYKSTSLSLSLSDLDIKSDWEPMFSDLGIDPKSFASISLITFLRRDIKAVDNSLFNFAKTIKPSNPHILESDTDPIGIISRACLILLITTKIIESMLRDSGTTKANLKFWLDNVGIKQGLWETTSTEPSLLTDLWSDIEIEMEEIDKWLNNTLVLHSPYTFKKDLKKNCPHIPNISRAYLWNMGI